MGWLADADPRGDDEEHPGSALEPFAASIAGIDTGHTGRIEGRLRERMHLWRQCTSDQTILGLIEDGLRIPFEEGRPPELHDDSNSVAPELMGWLDDQIGALITAGAIVPWEQHAETIRARGGTPGPRPRVVSPVFVHRKPSSTPENPKYRFIVDARALNEYVEKRGFTLEHLREFMKQLKPGDYLWSADLASAYFHISIHWEDVELLGFRHRGRYYVFCVLPFGLSISAWAFVKVASVAAKIMRERGLVDALCHYVDDFIGSNGRVRDPRRPLAAVQLLLDLGFALNPVKLKLELVRILEGLGHVLNTSRMTVTLTARRRERMIEAVDEAWAQRHDVSARVIARVAGHILAGELSYGLECRLRSRYLLRWVGIIAAGGSYSRRSVLLGRALNELEHWRRTARAFREQPMQPHRREATWVVEGDASASAVAAIVRVAPSGEWVGRRIRRELSAEERPRSSTLREMLGYGHTVRLLAERGALTATDVLELVGDSKCAECIFRKGGSQAGYVEGERLALAIGSAARHSRLHRGHRLRGALPVDEALQHHGGGRALEVHRPHGLRPPTAGAPQRPASLGRVRRRQICGAP